MSGLENEPGDNEPGERNFEQEARSEGWKPLEKFKGDPGKWIDAEEFVKRGENILPLVNAKNEKLRNELDQQKQTITEMRAAMDEFKLFHEETSLKLKKDAKDAYTKAETDLKAARKQARVDGDDDRVDELNDALVDLKKEAEIEAKKLEKAPTNKPIEDISKTKEYQEWVADNPWFGDTDDKTNARKSRYAVSVGQEIRSKNPAISLKDFFEQVSEEIDETFGESKPARRETSRVEGSRRGSGGGNGHSYVDLPAEARAECDKDAKKFVGENKAYKTAKEWQAKFAKLYFGQE